jgi:hypothetical protein
MSMLLGLARRLRRWFSIVASLVWRVLRVLLILLAGMLGGALSPPPPPPRPKPPSEKVDSEGEKREAR